MKGLGSLGFRTDTGEGLKPRQVERVERLLVGHVVEDVKKVPARECGVVIRRQSVVRRCVVSPRV